MKIRDGKNPEGWDFFFFTALYFLINGLVFDKDVTPWFEKKWMIFGPSGIKLFSTIG
jgi:hypothetical protein